MKAQGAPKDFVRPSDLIVWFKETQDAVAAANVAASAASKQRATGRPNVPAVAVVPSRAPAADRINATAEPRKSRFASL